MPLPSRPGLGSSTLAIVRDSEASGDLAHSQYALSDTSKAQTSAGRWPRPLKLALVAAVVTVVAALAIGLGIASAAGSLSSSSVADSNSSSGVGKDGDVARSTDSNSATPTVTSWTATTSSATVTKTVDPIIRALATGDSRGVTLARVMLATRELIDEQQADYLAVQQALYGLDMAPSSSLFGNVTWDPSQNSIYLTSLDSRNIPILRTNWEYKNGITGTSVDLAFVGRSNLPSGARYAVFGGNPLAVRGNAAMDTFMANVVSWLTQRSNFTGLRVVVAHVPGTESYFRHESPTRTWLVGQIPGVAINNVTTSPATQAENRCDGSLLPACLQSADLLVLGASEGPTEYSGTVLIQAVTDAQSRGVPVLFLHHSWDSTDIDARMLEYFGLDSDLNYWDQAGLLAFNASSIPRKVPFLGSVRDLVGRLETGNFTTDWSGCVLDLSRIACSGDARYMSEFGTTAGTLRTTMRALDAGNTAIFDGSGNGLEKLLVLLGDKYRETVRYPVSKTANTTAWFRGYYSDVVSYIHRPYTSVAPAGLGTFSKTIPSTIPPISRTVTLDTPTSGTRDFMTGLYVIPGRTVTLTRVDSGMSSVTFGINMIRDTTWIFNEPRGLDRPTMLSSPRSPLVAGQTVTITSPYGGPLFLFVDATGSGAVQTVSVKVDGVTTLPVLRNANDAAQIASFDAEMKTTATNWVGLTTDTLILHSLLDYFNQSVLKYGNVTRLVSLTWTYTIKDTYELAGFNAASGQLSLSTAASAFCATNGWNCTGPQHRRDVVQHVICDSRAMNGAGTSGNPYDQDWAFDPLGFGESHEIGHNIQNRRLKIYNDRSTEVSNNIFPIHKHFMWNLSPDGCSNPYVDRPGTGLQVFNILKGSLNSSDPFTSVYNAIWLDSSYAANNSPRVMFYRQLVEFARYYSGASLGDGWALVTLLYLQDRNFASAQTGNWTVLAPAMGMSAYTTYPSSISANDFMLASASFIMAVDLRPIFDMWGVSYTAAASAQVAAYAFPVVQKFLFPMRHLSAIPNKVGPPILISPTAVYSEPS